MVKVVKLRQFRGDRFNGRRDMAIFRLEYGDFLTFQDGGRRHVGLLKYENFYGRTAQEG